MTMARKSKLKSRKIVEASKAKIKSVKRIKSRNKSNSSMFLFSQTFPSSVLLPNLLPLQNCSGWSRASSGQYTVASELEYSGVGVLLRSWSTPELEYYSGVGVLRSKSLFWPRAGVLLRSIGVLRSWSTPE